MKQKETKWKTIEKEPEGSVFFCEGIRQQAAIALKELSYSGKQSRLRTYRRFSEQMVLHFDKGEQSEEIILNHLHAIVSREKTVKFRYY